MIWEDAEQKLIKHFDLGWNAVYGDPPTYPVNFPNAAKVDVPTKGGAYLRFRVIVDGADRVAVGGPLRISSGEVVINTFVPLGTGTDLVTELHKAITEIWDTAKSNGLDGGIHLGAPGPITGIRDPNVPTLWRSGVSVPFTIDHTPSTA